MDPKQSLPLSCQFSSYQILELRILTDAEAAKPSLVVETDARIVKDTPSKFMVRLLVAYNAGFVRFNCALQGNFIYHEAINETNIRQAWCNGGTMLYGVARGIYTPLAAQCGSKVQFLPAVMMANAVQKRIEEIVAESKAAAAAASGNAPSVPVATPAVQPTPADSVGVQK